MPQLKSNPRLADFLDGLGFLLASALLAWMCIRYAQTPSPMHSEHQSIFGMEKEKMPPSGDSKVTGKSHRGCSLFTRARR